MNIANIESAIAIMHRAGKVDMTSYQKTCRWNSPGIVSTEEELHKCGNAACFAGWVAVSPEFRADGGYQCGGSPTLETKEDYCSGAQAIAKWLDIPDSIACALVYGNCYQINDDDDEESTEFSGYYDKPWKSVTADDVIAKLESLLNSMPRDDHEQP